MESTTLRPSTPPQRAPRSNLMLSPSRMPQPLLSPGPAMRTPQPVGPLSPVNQNGSFAWDRVIKSGKVSRRVKKKGAWKSSWKEAYLVLRPNLLSVYKDKDETELRISITLSDVTAVAPVKKSRTQNVFGVFSPTKNHHFAGLTPQETANWISLLRIEAHTDEQDELEPPNPAFKNNDTKYDTTDHSADDEPDPTGSPDAPNAFIRPHKHRTNPMTPSAQQPRNISSTTYTSTINYPTHEAYTTSQSSMSDSAPHLSTSAPHPHSHSHSNRSSYLASSLPKNPSPLPPIADETPLQTTTTPFPTIRPTDSLQHSTTSTGHPISHSLHPHPTPQHQPNRPKSATLDPSRIIKQSHLKLLRTTPHPSTLGIPTKQWKSIWTVLRPQSLSFYKSQSEYTPLAIIPCWSIVEAGETEREGRNKRREKSSGVDDAGAGKELWTFQVIGEEKTWRLAAGSEAELVEWLGAFKSVVVGWREGRKDRVFSDGSGSHKQAGAALQPVRVVDWEEVLGEGTADLEKLKLEAGNGESASAGSGIARGETAAALSSSAPVHVGPGLAAERL